MLAVLHLQPIKRKFKEVVGVLFGGFIPRQQPVEKECAADFTRTVGTNGTVFNMFARLGVDLVGKALVCARLAFISRFSFIVSPPFLDTKKDYR